MKKIFIGIATSFLILLSQAALADKLIITGQPVVVTKSGDYYSFPANTTTYTTTSDYYYVTLNGAKKVCYREPQTTLSGATPMDIAFRIGNDTVTVHCYTYSSDYFTTQ